MHYLALIVGSITLLVIAAALVIIAIPTQPITRKQVHGLLYSTLRSLVQIIAAVVILMCLGYTVYYTGDSLLTLLEK